MNRRDPGFDVWVVFADMLIGFLCVIFLLRAVPIPPVITTPPLPADNDALRAELDALRAELEEAQHRLREQAETIRVLNEQPPILTLAETEARFRFPSGSAELSQTFRESLSKDVVPQILHAKQKYRINTVQVIGHTDEVPLSNLASTLDKGLIAFIWANAAVAPGSNTDLAMLRAVAVLKVLREHPELTDLKLVPYSAGQLLLPPDDVLSPGQDKGQNPDRRRVVIRLTRSGP